MADICMCQGKGCNSKEKCYRYKAKPTPAWQSFFIEVPGSTNDACEYFWDITSPWDGKK